MTLGTGGRMKLIRVSGKIEAASSEFVFVHA